MLSFRWDTVAVVAVVTLLLGYLMLQAVLRANGARLLAAFRLARDNASDEPNLCDALAARRSDSSGAFRPRRRRIS